MNSGIAIGVIIIAGYIFIKVASNLIMEAFVKPDFEKSSKAKETNK